MSYNLSFADNVTNIYDVTVGINSVANNVPAIIFLFLLWGGVYSVYQHSDNIKAFITSSFVAGIVAGFMWFIGLIGWYIAIVPLIGLLAGIIIKSTRG